MGKFCGNCGAPLDDGARVCGQCGTPVDGAAAPSPALHMTDPEKQKQRKKTIRFAALAAGVLAAALLLINLVPRYTGYRGLLRRTMAAFEDYDIDALVSMSSDLYYYYDEDYAEEYFEYTVGSALDHFESVVGYGYSLSYEVDDAHDLSERRLDSLRDELESSYPDFDVEEIRRVVVAEITVTAKEGRQSTRQHLQLTMTREDGGWRLLFLQ